MKISKKDLRRIIIENVLGTRTLKEGVNLNSAWRAASNFKKSPQDEDARPELERFKQKLEQHKKDSDGPFRRDKGRATEAQALLDKIIELLEANPQSVESIPLPLEPAKDPESDGVTDDGDGEQGREEAPSDDPKIYKYPGDTAYEYKVNQETGCWMARKKPNGNWFSMKKYKENMWNLDQAFPNARTDAQREQCPNKKPASSPAPESNESRTPEPGTFLKFGNVIYRYDTNAGHVEYFKGKGYGNFMLNQPGETALVQIMKDSDGLMFIGRNGLQLIMPDKDKTWMGASGDQPQSADHYQTMKKLYGDILERGQVVEEPQSISESLSRGSLLRRRYWGRY